MKKFVVLLFTMHCHAAMTQPHFRYKPVGDDELLWWKQTDTVFHADGRIEQIICKEIHEGVFSPERQARYNIPVDSNVVSIAERIIYRDLFYYNNDSTFSHIAREKHWAETKQPVNGAEDQPLQRNVTDTVFHPNGLINRIHYSETREIILSREMQFAYNLPGDSVVVLLSDDLVYTEVYFYNNDWTLNRIEKYVPSQKKPYYVNGYDDEIQLGPAARKVYMGKTGFADSVSISIINHAVVPINLTPTCEGFAVTSGFSEITVPPLDTVLFEFTIGLDHGDHSYKITLSNDSIVRSFGIHTYGYDVSGDDFVEGKTFSLSAHFIHYRTGNEALLTVYDRKRKKVLTRVPLSGLKNEIYLGLKPGEYWIEQTDYSSNKTVGCRLILIDGPAVANVHQLD